MNDPICYIYISIAVVSNLVALVAIALKSKPLKQVTFFLSLALYLPGLAMVCGDLAVAPYNLPFYIGMASLGISAGITCGFESRTWKIICIVALTFAVFGILEESIGGRYIGKELEKARELP